KTITDQKKLFTGNTESYTIKYRFIILITPDLKEEEVIAVFQETTVSGRVTDSDGQPLPGVTVVIKGNPAATVTAADGTYSLANVPRSATLVFSSIGMLTREIAVGTQSSINVIMEEEAIGDRKSTRLNSSHVKISYA